jgi:hypothetical protein
MQQGGATPDENGGDRDGDFHRRLADGAASDDTADTRSLGAAEHLSVESRPEVGNKPRRYTCRESEQERGPSRPRFRTCHDHDFRR